MKLLVSGGIAVGKSTVAAAVAVAMGGRVVRVRQALAEMLDVSVNDRRQLQVEGAALDQRTHGRWLLHYLEERVNPAELVIVDALRTRRQTLPLLDLPHTFLVHLAAHDGVRRVRYAQAARTDRLKAGTPYDAAVRHETERAANEIRDLASLVVESDDLTVDETVSLIVAYCGQAGLGSAADPT